MHIPPLKPRSAIVALHLAVIALSNYLAFWLRFDGDIPPPAQSLFLQTLPWLVALRGAVFVPFGLYGGLWRYTSVWDLRNIAAAVGVSTLAFGVLARGILQLDTYPRSVFIIDAVLLLVAVGGIRLAARLQPMRPQSAHAKRVLIYGAGDAGEMIARDMQRHASYCPVGFVDDAPSKVGQRIHGVRVLGTRHDLPGIVERERPQEVLVAIPSADPATIRGIVEALRPFKVKLTTLPGRQELGDGRAFVRQIRPLSIEDLLARAPIGLDMTQVSELIANKRVMVTGAGGSIGSELCRQVAALQPASLVLYERYENSLFEVANDVTERTRALDVHAVIGDVTDERRLDAVMATYRPEIIFHAAAHKHVPLMEDNVCEAVKNNVTGTRLVAEAAERYSVERFVLISTDKAVRPSSVMGATKRVAELMLQSLSQRNASRFVAVRFGNVLGSNGSVIPRFLQQIKNGGPVTVTHPEMRRFFMMIPEAVQLVLQAGALGKGGDLFVLDMGEQIPLVELARNLIRLSGLVPDQDIAIEYIGLRPGEKLYEEVACDDETLTPSAVEKVWRVTPGARVTPALLSFQIAELEDAARRGDTEGVIQSLHDIVATYQPGDAPGRQLTHARHTARRQPVMVRRRFADDMPFEYVQVIVDRREPHRRTRRSVFRGGRRSIDVPAAAPEIVSVAAVSAPSSGGWPAGVGALTTQATQQ